jgi:Tol biopolymer transport system component
VYVAGGSGDGRTLAWVDRSGNVQPLAAPAGSYATPRLSPDGRSLAVGIAGSPDQIFTYSIPENRFAQLTFDGGASPVWSNDGQRIFFSAARGGPSAVFVTAADGSGGEHRLTRGQQAQVPHSALPAEGGVLFVELDATSGRDISLLGTDGSARKLIATPANESAPSISPDGRTLAYVSDETGRPEVFVASLDNPARRVRVSVQGGTEPVWRRDGGELFFRSGSRMMAADVGTRPAVYAKPPRQLFEAAFHPGSAGSPGYDVSSDGTRFLMLRPAASDTERRELRVALGWGEGLKRQGR